MIFLMYVFSDVEHSRLNKHFFARFIFGAFRNALTGTVQSRKESVMEKMNDGQTQIQAAS